MNWFKSRKKSNAQEKQEIDTTSEVVAEEYAEDNKEDSLNVYLSQLPDDTEFGNNALIEITDKNIIARLSAMAPQLSQAKVIGKNIATALKQQEAFAQPLYRVVLTKGGELADSKNLAGAKRAFTLGKNGIKENADLVQVNVDKIDIARNVGAMAMNIASMVVGQYYMNQISSQMEVINESLDKLIEIEEIKYKSEVATLIESVYKSAKFQISNIATEELRKLESNKIQELERECQNLLNQAENQLVAIVNKQIKEFKQYEKTVFDIKKWSKYAEILLKLLYQIDCLDLAMSLGQKTNEQSFLIYNSHKEKATEMAKQLELWHQEQCKTFQIDLENSKVARWEGLLSFIEKPLGLINSELNYKELNPKKKQLILNQTKNDEEQTDNFDNLFNYDVQIIVKEGKYYYLPNTGNNI